VLDWGGRRDGIPFVMLHGVGGTALFCNRIAPELVDLHGADYRFLSIDQRGSGDSDKPETGYGPEACSRDVLAVLDAFGFEQPAVLAGHSRGGWQAIHLAAGWPERFAKLLLLDPARLTYESMTALDRFYGDVRAGFGPFESREAALDAARSRRPDANWSPERQASLFDALLETPSGGFFGKMPPRVLAQLATARLDATASRDLARSVKIPATLLVSSRSDAHRTSQKLEYAELLADCEVVMLDGTHHLAHDRPDEVIAAATALLTGTRS